MPFYLPYKALAEERKTAEYDHDEECDYGDRETGPVLVPIGVGGKAAELDSKMRTLRYQHSDLFSICDTLETAKNTYLNGIERAAEEAKRAKEAADTERNLQEIIELTRHQHYPRI